MKLMADYTKQEQRVQGIAADLEEQINQKTEKVTASSIKSSSFQILD